MMKTFSEFKESLESSLPPGELSPQLASLWYDAKNNWQRAHGLVDHLDDQGAAWVHAYLHRKEGDSGNADYWYRKAGKLRPVVSLAEEWKLLVEHFLYS
ncbi:hypothetical protein AAFN85_03460 [Mucilaginibacter sp. CAU 1740]|uniref:hypothetical protein n=1 Tax=Mucilaginibacter sp. CAU 1740 TaxID=3140365 RepID=UPI00325C1D29